MRFYRGDNDFDNNYSFGSQINHRWRADLAAMKAMFRI